MGIETIIAALGVAASIGGTAAGVAAGQEQASGQKQALEAQKQAEELRRRQMNLDALRKRREIVRQSLSARAAALATGTAQGAAVEGASGIEGAYGTIAGQAGRAAQGVTQNQQLGNMIFDANAQGLEGQMRMANGASMASMAGGISSLGNQFIKNISTWNRIGGSWDL